MAGQRHHSPPRLAALPTLPCTTGRCCLRLFTSQKQASGVSLQLHNLPRPGLSTGLFSHLPFPPDAPGPCGPLCPLVVSCACERGLSSLLHQPECCLPPLRNPLTQAHHSLGAPAGTPHIPWLLALGLPGVGRGPVSGSPRSQDGSGVGLASSPQSRSPLTRQTRLPCLPGSRLQGTRGPPRLRNCRGGTDKPAMLACPTAGRAPPQD